MNLFIFQSQGQTFDKVGVVLNNNVFSHGQLYVAMSRVRQLSNVRCLICRSIMLIEFKIRIFSSSSLEIDDKKVVVIYNVVKTQILSDVREVSIE